MSRRDFQIFFTGMFLLTLIGCSTNTDLGGSGVPNSRPDTRVTGQPPTLLQAGYTVHFNWTGSDPDGRVVGFQWKISDNGLDGISPRDTLTVDPLTGATINPWRFTTMNDTLFYVLADLEDFPDDPENHARSYRTHSLFVRAVDEDGAVDPSPALISFTSTTIIPTCRATFPSINPATQIAPLVPQTVNLGYTGNDSDYDLKNPTHVRFLWKQSVIEGPAGQPIIIANEHFYNSYMHQLIDFEDPNWSEWQPFAIDKDRRKIRFEDQVDEEVFLFAVQVRDTAGAVSIGKNYQEQVLNVRIKADRFRPTLTLFEVYQGVIRDPITVNLAADQPLNFTWIADASEYNGTIISMRHGWDLLDPDDPNDPGWGPAPGLTDQNRHAEERSYSIGEHSFWLRVVDDGGGVAVLRYGISIIPYVSPASQLSLALVDQVEDSQTSGWGNVDPPGVPTVYYDQEIHRHNFWRFLEANGGVAGFNWLRDAFHSGEDLNERFEYENAVKYKAVLVFARAHRDQQMFGTFRPQGRVDPFVWLTPYQTKGGNLFMVGARSMESFLEDRQYMLPIIFDSTVEDYSLGDNTYVVGFGENELYDGTKYYRGPKMYPYATAGITALDWASPQGIKYIYGRSATASTERNDKCSGLKQLKLVNNFKAEHLIGAGVIADTIGTNPLIDWRDIVPTTPMNLNTRFPFPGDEFVNDKISDRPTALILQNCDEGYDGLCIEPMFSGIARMDWMREKMWEDGDTQWPASTMDADSLRNVCGEMALTTYLDDNGVLHPLASARSTNKTYGWLSYKTVENKPSGKADVYWGFDPFRFETVESQKAIMWVLEYFGLPVRTGEVTP
jgi:hypothetical protein